MPKPLLASFLLRIGIASVFLYAAVASFLDPASWIGYLPSFLREMFGATLLLTLFSLYQIGLALWLLSGFRAYRAALLASITMLAILIANSGALDIVFRDIAILFATAALAALEKPSVSLGIRN